MFTIKWNGDYAKYSVTFEDGWTRLNSCNAATYKRSEWSHDGLKIEERKNREIKTQTFYLVSYATPIIYIRRKYYMDNGEIISNNIYVNEVHWNCSRTTIQHISRFCRNLERKYGIGINYFDVANAMRSTDLQFDISMKIKKHMRVIHVAPVYIKAVFDAECPRFYKTL